MEVVMIGLGITVAAIAAFICSSVYYVAVTPIERRIVGDAALDRGRPETWKVLLEVLRTAVLAAAFGLSTSEARRLIGDGAVKADGEVVREFDLARPRLENALVQAGKRRFVRLTPS